MTRTEYQTQPAAPFNGHPSWEHWNVALWFTNDEGLYRLAQSSADALTLSDTLDALEVEETPDGVTLTTELAVYAWECVNEE